MNNRKLTKILITTFTNLLLIFPAAIKPQISNCLEHYKPLSLGCKTCSPKFFKKYSFYFQCFKCPPNCDHCNEKNCKQCSSGYYPKLLNSTKTCFKCPENCEECSSYQKCTKCVVGAVIRGSICTAGNSSISLFVLVLLTAASFLVCFRTVTNQIDKDIILKKKARNKEDRERLRAQRMRIVTDMTIESMLAVRNTRLDSGDLKVLEGKEIKKEHIDKVNRKFLKGGTKFGRSGFFGKEENEGEEEKGNLHSSAFQTRKKGKTLKIR